MGNECSIVRRGGGASLNYKVVGGTTQPTSAKENTIWVDTTVDKEAISRVETTQLPYYIKDTTGVVTKPSSNACYTRYFKCVAGKEYRIQLNDAQTVCIAKFTEVPNTGVTGTVVYGTGKTHGEETLDYTISGEMPGGGVAEGYIGIYFYDSSANDAVPVLKVTDLALKENLPDALNITSYAISAAEPENPVDGMVWIDTSDSSSISMNVLKKGDALMVYLLDAKQYTAAAETWVNKDAQIYQNSAWTSLSPFPMSLIPVAVADQSKWKFEKTGSSFTAEGYINVHKNSIETIDYLDAIDLSTAGEIIVTYAQSYSFVPILNVINATTGNREFTITGTTSKSMTLDVSTAQGLYYLQITTDDWYGDRKLILQSLDITRRA